MSDQSTNKRLFRKATREDLLGSGESKSPVLVPSSQSGRRVSRLILETMVTLDLIAAFLLLAGDFVAGLIVLVISSAVLAIRLSLRQRRMQQVSALEEQGEGGRLDD
ncbi:MAG: hypothetical protein WBQ14_08430 [Gaiellaceae bacterium]